MLRIDFYVQHLVRHNATAVELLSGTSVRFCFPSGDKRSSKSIAHEQVARLVTEAAAANVVEELESAGRASFRHASGAGLDVQVEVHKLSADKWRVMLTPAADDAREAGPAPISIPPAAAIPAGAADLPGGVAPRHATTTMDPQIDAAAGRVRASLRAPSRPRKKSQVALGAGEPKINKYLRMMVEQDASDLHLSSTVAPMARISGEMKVLEDRAPFTPEELRELIWEIMPDRNRVEFDEQWDTDFAHNIEGVARFRGNAFVDRHGIGGVFRQIPFDLLTVKQIGLPPRVLDLCWLSKGLVLVTGPTGSGKSTTLATLIDYINDNRSDHIITIEDPVEFVHANKKCLVNQREVGTHTRTFKNALRAALREDPDIVLVGEMRDLETIAIAIETAETGHLVFGTLHTTSAVSTVDRIIDQFPVDQQAQIRVMLSESLRGVVAQVLCKKEGGGRVAAYEVLMSNPACANLIREGKTYQLTSVMQTGGRLGMQTLNDHLLEHVKARRVSPEEAYIKSNEKALLKTKFEFEGIELNLNVDA